MASLDKYRIFFTQVQAVQQKLCTPDNNYILDMEIKMQKRVEENYPLSSQKVQDWVKHRGLERINQFKPQFLIDKDERYAKFAKPLSGYINQKDLDRLDRHMDLFIKPKTRAQAQKRIYLLKKKIREEQAADDELRHRQNSFIAAKF